VTDYSYVASYDVRKILWKELKDHNLFKEEDYYADGFSSPLIPIIPAQQVPEFNNLLAGKTYIIYDIMQNATAETFWMSEETITFTVVSRSAIEIQTLINFLTDLFRRYDLTARDVNLTLVASSPYRYYWFKVDSADPVQAFINEGGFMDAPISITYSYSREVDSSTGRYI
jgi:hypothetical protein